MSNAIEIVPELKLKNYDSHFVLPRSRNWDKGEQARILRMFLQGVGLPQVRFHDLRATWATIMLSKGIEPIKVMSMGGWKSLKTMQIYIRKAGVNIKGITNSLDLHDPSEQESKVLSFASVSTNQ
ncbi:MAG: tyrosine-type recombinase/integrase [Pseudobdellovibrionaceae bacterium]